MSSDPTAAQTSRYPGWTVAIQRNIAGVGAAEPGERRRVAEHQRRRQVDRRATAGGGGSTSSDSRSYVPFGFVIRERRSGRPERLRDRDVGGGVSTASSSDPGERDRGRPRPTRPPSGRSTRRPPSA